jgi:hypothetical protein
LRGELPVAFSKAVSNEIPFFARAASNELSGGGMGSSSFKVLFEDEPFFMAEV